MEKVSMMKLIKIIEENYAPAEYLYDTTNQKAGEMEDMKESVCYTQILFSASINRIALKNPYGTRVFTRIKGLFFEEENPWGEIVIVCGNQFDSNDDTMHTVLVQHCSISKEIEKKLSGKE